MAVRPKENGKWLTDVTVGRKPDGSPDRKVKTSDTENEAIYWEHRFKVEKKARKGQIEEDTTLSEFVEIVFWPKKNNLTQGTKGNYNRVLRHDILPVLGEVKIDEITPMLVQDMISACSTRKSGQRAREVLSTILSVAYDGTDHANAASGRHFVYPRPAPQKASRKGVVLSRYSTHFKLLDHVRIHYPNLAEERICVLGLGLGLRPEEALGLDWELGVSLEKRVVSIFQAYAEGEGGEHLKEVKTPKGRRTIPMTSYVYSRMCEWASEIKESRDWWGKPTANIYGEPSHPVITNKLGGRMSHYSARICVRRLRSGYYDDGIKIPAFTQWSLRHSYGTAAILDGKMDVNLLQLLMGHESSDMTRRLYVKPQEEDLVEAVSAIDSIYSANGFSEP